MRFSSSSARSTMTWCLAVVMGLVASIATAATTAPEIAGVPQTRADDGPLTALGRSWSEVVVSLGQAMSGAPSFGPVLVFSKARCPSVDDGASLDCGLAADRICREAGRTTGISFDQTTSRTCRGSVASQTNGLSLSCKPLAWISHALCW
ncbi:hypothetical protein SAMN04487843_1398 [Methylobacterium sp. ap11]|uniref:hypothetical protein n=1 Tax=Methylobacterium sp. ap11 TaxID=1761799 RepID=UPI0008B1156B|nr:hypothetical protein [Methylobacterium sp. ap11]SEP50670.1 hypothetical protein SAMN04487843_1398 [Methylobacterium sp. ap11]